MQRVAGHAETDSGHLLVQMLEMLTSKDTVTGSTVLVAAAKSGNAVTFKATFSAVNDALGQDKTKVRQA